MPTSRAPRPSSGTDSRTSSSEPRRSSLPPSSNPRLSRGVRRRRTSHSLRLLGPIPLPATRNLMRRRIIPLSSRSSDRRSCQGGMAPLRPAKCAAASRPSTPARASRLRLRGSTRPPSLTRICRPDNRNAGLPAGIRKQFRALSILWQPLWRIFLRALITLRRHHEKGGLLPPCSTRWRLLLPASLTRQLLISTQITDHCRPWRGRDGTAASFLRRDQ